MIGPFLVFGGITAYFAHKRGYNWLCWFFACGLIGMIVVILMPSANREDISEEEKAAIIKRGNRVGAILTGISGLLSIIAYYLIYTTKVHQH